MPRTVRSRAARVTPGLQLALTLLLLALSPQLLAAPQDPPTSGSPQGPSGNPGEAAPPAQGEEGRPPAVAEGGAEADADVSPTVKTKQEILLLVDQVRGFLDEAQRRESRSPELEQIIASAQTTLVEADGVQEIASLPRLETLRDQLLAFSNQLYEMLRAQPSAGSPETTPGVASGEQIAAGGPPGVSPEPPPAGAVVDPTGGPPAELRAAVQAYFDGRYPAALQILQRTAFAEPRAAAQALLLRAAARYALYLMDGEHDAASLAAARADVAECRRLDPALAPTAEAFSPRFIRFFNQVDLPTSTSASE